MKGKRFFIASVIILLLASCSKKLIPEKPFLPATDFKLDSLPDSEINIPVKINLNPVYQLAEKSLDTVFTSPNYPDDWIQEGCDIRYKYIFRRGPLQLKSSGTRLDLGFTGFYKIIGSTRVCVGGTVISPWTPPCRCGFNEGERMVNVAFHGSVTLQPDYKVRLNIQRQEPVPLNKCEVCFWGQDITRQVMNGLKDELDAAKLEIEKTYGVVDFKPKFQALWDELNKSHNLYGLGWLQVNPQNIQLTSMYARQDSLNLFFGLSARPVISFEKPDEQTSWVPNISDFRRNPGFTIFLDARLNYDSLSRILNEQLKGKKLDINKGPVNKTFIVKKCSVYGTGNERLILKIEFSGSNSGIIYLTGKPVYNSFAETLEIRELDFDIRTKNLLLRNAEWLFNKKILAELNKYTRFDLSSWFFNAKMAAHAQLNREWVSGLRSYGIITDMKLTGLYPTNKYLVVRSHCSGHLSVEADTIDFSF
jgi:hypothetical protein